MSPTLSQNNAHISLNIHHVAIKLESLELSHYFAHFLFKEPEFDSVPHVECLSLFAANAVVVFPQGFSSTIRRA